MTVQDQSRQTVVIESFLDWLAEHGALPPRQGNVPWAAFRDLRHLIDRQFQLDWTSLSLAMCRLLFGLATIRQPRRILIMGSHHGFAAAWLARRRPDRRSGRPPDAIIGVDPDQNANRIARMNAAALGHEHLFEVIDATAQDYLATAPQPFDLVFIDVDHPERGKADYADLISMALPHLTAGALVLAHDPLVPRFADDMDRFHDIISRTPTLAGPWILPVDECGLTVAVRHG